MIRTTRTFDLPNGAIFSFEGPYVWISTPDGKIMLSCSEMQDAARFAELLYTANKLGSPVENTEKSGTASS